MCQIYGTENLNAETVLDITDASGHVISLCPCTWSVPSFYEMNYGIIVISKDSSDKTELWNFGHRGFNRYVERN